MAGRPKRGEATLSLERIIDEAWRLVNRDGLPGLSTRRLASELGVQSPALYWYVKNKRQLLGLMVERILEGSIATVPEHADWWEWMRTVGRAQHQSLLANRDGGLIAANSSPTDRMRNEVFANAIARLEQAGFSRSEAAAAWGGMASLVLGTVIYQQNDDTRQFAEAFGDAGSNFDVALSAYILGLRAAATER